MEDKSATWYDTGRKKQICRDDLRDSPSRKSCCRALLRESTLVMVSVRFLPPRRLCYLYYHSLVLRAIFTRTSILNAYLSFFYVNLESWRNKFDQRKISRYKTTLRNCLKMQTRLHEYPKLSLPSYTSGITLQQI